MHGCYRFARSRLRVLGFDFAFDLGCADGLGCCGLPAVFGIFCSFGLNVDLAVGGCFVWWFGWIPWCLLAYC